MSWDAQPPPEQPQYPQQPPYPEQGGYPQQPPYPPAYPQQQYPQQPQRPYPQTDQYGQPHQQQQWDQPYGQPPGYAQPGSYAQPAPYAPEQTQPLAYDAYGQPMPPQHQAPVDSALPQWSQFAAPNDPFGGAPYGQPPQPPKRRKGMLIGLGVGAALVAAGVAAAVLANGSNGSTPAASGTNGAGASAGAQISTGPSDGSAGSGSTTSPDTGNGGSKQTHTIVVPQTAGTLHLLDNADTRQRASDIKSGLKGNKAYSDPKVGFYRLGSDSSYSVWMLAESTTTIPAFADSLGTLGDKGMAHEIAQVAKVSDVVDEPAGPLGGAMLCGNLALDGSKYGVCEWVDGSTFGWIYFTPSVSSDKALGYAQALRGAAER